jgi:translation initiation factor IF-2
MSEVTVKQLADTVGTPVDRLLKQMQEAGLSQTKDDEVVSDDEKQTLLAFLKRSHGEKSDAAPSKITLKRKTLGTLKTGQGRAGRTVNVEVRRKRTYVKRSETEGGGPAAEETQAAGPTQAELEAQRIREEDMARKSAEEETRRQEAEKKAEEERQAAEREQAAEAQRQAEVRAKEAEAAKEAVPAEDTRTLEEQAATAAAEAQAKQQATERGGKRTKSRDQGGAGRDQRAGGRFAHRPFRSKLRAVNFNSPSPPSRRWWKSATSYPLGNLRNGCPSRRVKLSRP